MSSAKLFGALFGFLLAMVSGTFAVDYCEGWRTMPCTCIRQFSRSILIQCQDMNSFADIVEGLKNDFGREQHITLEIDSSKLEDLHYRTFRELNMTIVNLKLNNSGLR